MEEFADLNAIRFDENTGRDIAGGKVAQRV